MSFQQKELMSGPPLAANLETYDQIGCELVADALRAGAETRVRVMGTSMLPALWPGDILVIRGGAPAPTCGDIVLFLRWRRLFAHRVVRATQSQLITRGDALRRRDPPVPPSDVLGVVVRIIRNDSSPISATPPSYWQRMLAFAIRRSEAMYRLVLRWHGAEVRLGWNDGTDRRSR